jgi:DNA polymerase epsilon subunit 1
LFADDSPQVNEITDMEDIGGKNKNQKLNGFAVSHKRKRTSVENSEQSQNESQSTQTWREILGPAPPMGKTKV